MERLTKLWQSKSKNEEVEQRDEIKKEAGSNKKFIMAHVTVDSCGLRGLQFESHPDPMRMTLFNWHVAQLRKLTNKNLDQR